MHKAKLLLNQLCIIMVLVIQAFHSCTENFTSAFYSNPFLVLKVQVYTPTEIKYCKSVASCTVTLSISYHGS